MSSGGAHAQGALVEALVVVVEGAHAAVDGVLPAIGY